MNNKKNIILYDGNCSFCSYWVKFVLKRDKKDIFRFTSLQSDTGKKLLNQFSITPTTDSVVLIANETAFVKSNAVFKILRLLGGWRIVFQSLLIFPRVVRDFVYDIVARSRYKLFARKTCELPLDSNYQNKFL